tara:strand:+ start:2049 stop:2228 length:180 start_codon:yes stop_codon:yes gene_type:complete
MSKTQIIGSILLLIGLGLFYFYNSTNWSLAGAVLTGFSAGVILVGKVVPFKKWPSKDTN